MQEVWSLEESTSQKSNGGLRMSNYQEKVIKEILKDVKVKCIKCHSDMIRVVDLYDRAVVGYSCKNCSHYNFLNQNVV